MLESILADASARTLTFGSQGSSFGFVVPGVWTGSKTGTTTTTVSTVAKDSWMMSFSTAVVTAVWNGNHDGSGLTSSSNTLVRRVVNDYMQPVHTELYANEGKWKPGDQPVKPGGIQTLSVNGRADIWPSWYNQRTSGVTKTTLVFNKYNKKLALECTPENLKEEVEVTKTIDPLTRAEVWNVPEGYDRNEKDDCKYEQPSVSIRKSSTKGLSTSIIEGSEPLKSYELTVDGQVVESGDINDGKISLKYEVTGKEKSIKITVIDATGTGVSDEL